MLAKSVHSRTAFVLLMGLVVFMSFIMAIGSISFFGGIAWTVVIALATLVLDDARILN